MSWDWGVLFPNCHEVGWGTWLVIEEHTAKSAEMTKMMILMIMMIMMETVTIRRKYGNDFNLKFKVMLFFCTIPHFTALMTCKYTKGFLPHQNPIFTIEWGKMGGCFGSTLGWNVVCCFGFNKLQSQAEKRCCYALICTLFVYFPSMFYTNHPVASPIRTNPICPLSTHCVLKFHPVLTHVYDLSSKCYNLCGQSQLLSLCNCVRRMSL